MLCNKDDLVLTLTLEQTHTRKGASPTCSQPLPPHPGTGATNRPVS